MHQLFYWKQEETKGKKGGKVKQLFENINFNNFKFLLKTNIIRAPLEVLVGAYLLGLYFGDKSFTTIIIPSIISLIVCFVYTIILSLVISWITWWNSAKIVITEKPIGFQYDVLDKRFAKCFLIIHMFGWAFYTGLSYFYAIVFHTKMFSVVIIGSLYGVLVNVYGYFSDRRINWSHIFKKFSDFNIGNNEGIKRNKRKSYLLAIAFQSVILLVISGWLIIILLSFQQSGSFRGLDADPVFSFSGILTLFIPIFILYIRETYVLFFDSNLQKDEKRVFASIQDFY